MEELPAAHKLRNFTSCYLVIESILCFYLLLCIIPTDSRDKGDPKKFKVYRTINVLFIYICCIPFLALRIISLLCCRSIRYVPKQVFGIWLPNLVCYSAWSLYALVKILQADKREEDDAFSFLFLNVVLLLCVFAFSICFVICGLPFFFFKLYSR